MRKTIVTLWLGLVFLASSWSLLQPGFFRVHDYVHGARIAEMTRAMQDGQFPVRWSENFGFGYGMPLFEFYAPLPYYLGSLFYWLSFDLILSIKLLFLLSNIGTVTGGYLLGKRMYGRVGGILVSAALTLAPYRAVNLFVRGALSEAWGIMAIPWILYALIGLVEAKSFSSARKSWVVMVLSLAVLLLSHNLVTLMFVPVSLIFAAGLMLIAWPKKLSKVKNKVTWLAMKLFTVVSGYVLALGLSAFYVFPAILEKNLTQIDSILSGYFYYSHHFLYIRQFFKVAWGYGGSEWGPDDGISFFLGYGQLLAALLVIPLLANHFLLKRKLSFKNLLTKLEMKKLLGWVVGRLTFSHKPAQVSLLVLLGTIFLGSLYLSLLKSEWLWNLLPLINFIQFPWRWLSVSIVFLALLGGFSMTLLGSTPVRYLVMVVLLLTILTNTIFFQPESYLERTSDFYYSDQNLIRSQMSQILPDFMPKGLRADVSDPSRLEVRGDLFYSVAEDTKDKVEVLVDRSHQKLIRTSFNQDQSLTLLIADYPGWTVKVNDQEISKVTTDQGLITADIPAGNNLVSAQLLGTPVRDYSDLVTLISIFVFLLVVVKPRVKGVISNG